MHVIIFSLRVIFMLSTIVYATDCCSSRILLLKEQTFKRQRTQKNLTSLASPQHPASTPPRASTAAIAPSNCSTQQQRMDVMANIAREYNKRFSGRYHGVLKDKEEAGEDSDEDSDEDVAEDIAEHLEAPKARLMLEKTTSVLKSAASSDGRNQKNIVFNRSYYDQPMQEFITDPAIREKHAGNPKYHTIDLYYKIMRDVLSYECLGNFLTDFCLNGGRCFRYPIANHSFYSCECADGYVGERCESKTIINELHMPASITLAKHGLPAQPKILMARVVFTFPALIVLSMIYIVIAVVFVIQRPKKPSYWVRRCTRLHVK